MNELFKHLQCGNANDLAQRVNYFEAKNFPTLGDACKTSYCYQSCINTCCWMIYLWHFGFRGTLTPRQILRKGVEMGTAYFRLVGGRLADTAPAETPTEAWFEPYSESLMLTTLGGNARERAQFSDCLRSSLLIEASAAPHTESALGDVLLCVAKYFQSSPMDTAALEERLQKSRKRRPKLLFNAWRALERNDRATFVSALADSTANFAKTTADDHLPLTAVAVLESILVGIAYERGWTNLSFDIPIAARLVTHQSLELA